MNLDTENSNRILLKSYIFNLNFLTVDIRIFMRINRQVRTSRFWWTMSSIEITGKKYACPRVCLTVWNAIHKNCRVLIYID